MVSFPFRKPRNVKQDSTKSSTLPKTLNHANLDKRQLRQATRTRKAFTILSSCLLLLAVVFLILVEIASISNKPVLRDLWFIKLNLSNVVPTSVPNSASLNSIARNLGLHDFYQVGLWNFCEGYFSSGISKCSTTRPLYWFNIVAIIKNELLQGSSITLPTQISNILHAIRIASHWMFGLFLTGTCLSFVLVFLAPLSVYTRWNALAITILTFLNALFITVASVIATIMFTVMRNVFKNNTDVNIGAKIGIAMFTCMWVASACAIFSFMINLCLMCCCASRRDVRKGKKRGNEKAYEILP